MKARGNDLPCVRSAEAQFDQHASERGHESRLTNGSTEEAVKTQLKALDVAFTILGCVGEQSRVALQRREPTAESKNSLRRETLQKRTVLTTPTGGHFLSRTVWKCAQFHTRVNTVTFASRPAYNGVWPRKVVESLNDDQNHAEESEWRSTKQN